MIILLCFQLAMAGILSPAEKQRIVAAAQEALRDTPNTIVAFPASRSAGGIHDYFSEGDYWWPDTTDASAPYIKKDGLTNPDNFVAHRHALVQFSMRVSTLVAAFRMTGDRAYGRQALRHLQAWFVEPRTRMTPHLLYAQAIKGRVTGRGIGIIDTIHLIEVSRCVQVLLRHGGITQEEAAPIIAWFDAYLLWMTTHRYGLEERAAKNNHGTWWVAQVASFATLTGNDALQDSCRMWYRSVLLPDQVSGDGSFPLELARTKPYIYSLFNLEGMSLICHILSRPGDDLWSFTLPDGRCLRRAFDYMAPFVMDKSRWPHGADVMHFELLPVRQMAWLFGGEAFDRPEYRDLWNRLSPDQRDHEIARTFVIREALLWIE